MADHHIPSAPRVRPAMEPDAPWSDRCMKTLNATERGTAVVYVVGEEGGGRFKIGCTTQLKKRIQQLSTGEGKKLHMQFWAEFPRAVAFKVEGASLKEIRDRLSIKGRGEWFNLGAQEMARAILDAASSLGVKPIIHAGFPGALDPSPTEVELLLSEPMPFQPSGGRLDREFWAPQSRSVTYCKP